jgi:glycerol kinase
LVSSNYKDIDDGDGMAYILALDQGTSSSRAMVFDSNGRHTSLAQKSLTQIFPQPGWVEHNAQEIWSTQLECAQQALSNAGIVAQNLSAIGITNQRETTVLWSKRSGQPIHNAIVWQDRRTTPWCEAQRAAGLESMVRAKTGLMIDPYFSASKIVWLLEHVPGARKLADNGELLFGTVDTWLIWKLTNGEKHVTDVTNASRTLLYNIEDSEWDQDLLQRWNIPANILPEVQVSGSHFGSTRTGQKHLRHRVFFHVTYWRKLVSISAWPANHPYRPSVKTASIRPGRGSFQYRLTDSVVTRRPGHYSVEQ